MRISDHLDYAPLYTGGPLSKTYSPTRPPCNVIEALGTYGSIALYASLATTAASTAISVQSAKTAAKQEEMNAEAQNKALLNEKNRQQLEFQENQRRLAAEQKRFRATQLSKILDSGIAGGTGTALEIEADTWQRQQTQLNDRSYVNSLNQTELGYRASSVLEMGEANAAQYRRQATGSIIEGIGSAVGTVGSAYIKTGSTTGKTASNSALTTGATGASYTSSK